MHHYNVTSSEILAALLYLHKMNRTSVRTLETLQRQILLVLSSDGSRSK